MAITILMVMVLIASMVFQQSNDAFSEGRHKTESQTAMRSVLGIISRDLLQAVDSTKFENPGSFGNKFPKETGKSIEFLALTGSGDSETSRALQFIKYELANGYVTRSVKSVKNNGGALSPGLNVSDSVLNTLPIGDLKFNVTWPDGSSVETSMPSRVEIEISTSEKGYSFGSFAGRSAGPDGIWGKNEKGKTDDIVIGDWPDEE